MGTTLKKEITLTAKAGKPLQISDEAVIENASPGSSPIIAMARTLKVYREAAMKLLEGNYSGVRNLAPPHFRLLCDIFIFACTDGIVVRYDRMSGNEPKVRAAEIHDSLEKIAPGFSEQVVHFPSDPNTYASSALGPGFQLIRRDASGNEFEDIAPLRPTVFSSTKFSPDFVLPVPGMRPPCFVSLTNEFVIETHGILVNGSEAPTNVADDVEHFLTHGKIRLSVGWEAIEIYPLLKEDYWRPELAPMTLLGTPGDNDETHFKRLSAENARN